MDWLDGFEYDAPTDYTPNIDLDIFPEDMAQIDWDKVALPSGTSYGSPLDFLYAATASGADPSLLDKIKSGGISALKALTQDKDGNLDMRKLATIGGGLAGLLGSSGGLKGLFGGSGGQQQPAGYQGKIPQLAAVRQQIQPTASTRPGEAGRRYFTDIQYVPRESAPVALAAGGLAELAKGRYLGGPTDGMADELPADIDGKEPAKLSHGEFVIPADVVSHLGNGNSDAGAQRLYEMMDRIRKARTGTTKQGRKINPNKLLPS